MFRLVLDDYGKPAILRFCETCGVLDGPFEPADVPGDILAALISTANQSDEEQ